MRLDTVLRRRKYPRTADQLRASNLQSRWWYYSVELLPGISSVGQYPKEFPLLPRIVLRNCGIAGKTCWDVGTMEGLIPTLMCRRGAKRVVATDFSDHCLEKLRAVQHYYRVSFEFVRVGLLYDVGEQLRRHRYGGFDLINLSGVLYHVFSPLLVLCAVRPLLKRNGLLIVSTNVVHDRSFTMEFNNAGRLQSETNTFWYPSIPLLDYWLRYLKLRPIDCLYLPHSAIESSVRYVFDKPSGYLSVVCRATDTVLPTADDGWMSRSERESWEHQQLTRWDLCARQPVSEIRYGPVQGTTLRRDDGAIMDLWREVQSRDEIVRAIDPQDSHVLSLTDTI